MLFVCTTCEIFYTFRGKKKVWLVWLSCVLSSQISFCVYPPHSTSQAIKTELVKDTRGTLSLWLRRPCRHKWLCCGVLRQRTPAPVPFTASSLSCLLLNGSESEVQNSHAQFCVARCQTPHICQPVFSLSVPGTHARNWTPPHPAPLKNTGQTKQARQEYIQRKVVLSQSDLSYTNWEGKKR